MQMFSRLLKRLWNHSARRVMKLRTLNYLMTRKFPWPCTTSSIRRRFQQILRDLMGFATVFQFLHPIFRKNTQKRAVSDSGLKSDAGFSSAPLCFRPDMPMRTTGKLLRYGRLFGRILHGRFPPEADPPSEENQ